jgi:hypothetical protein
MVPTLEDTEEAMYETLVSLGDGWHDRTELAHKLGKKKLSTAQAIALEISVRSGKIEKQNQVAGPYGNVNKHVYKVKA